MLTSNLNFRFDEIELSKPYKYYVNHKLKLGQHMLVVASDKWNKWRTRESKDLKCPIITLPII